MSHDFPIQQFVRIEANQITDAVNLLIVDINALFASLGVGAGAYASQHQLRAWASNNGSPLYIYTLDQAVNALISNDINIRWNHSPTIVQGDPLYLFIQTTLGFTTLQMLAALAAMQAYPP